MLLGVIIMTIIQSFIQSVGQWNWLKINGNWIELKVVYVTCQSAVCQLLLAMSNLASQTIEHKNV